MSEGVQFLPNKKFIKPISPIAGIPPKNINIHINITAIIDVQAEMKISSP